MCWASLIHSDELLVVFAAGAAFVQGVTPDERGLEEKGQEAVNRFFSIPIFALLGTTIPWAGWHALGWSGVLLANRDPVAPPSAGVAAVESLPSELAPAARRAIPRMVRPIAVVAIYYAALAEHRLGDPLIWHVVSLVICASVVAHGLTATPLTRLYGRTVSPRGHDK